MVESIASVETSSNGYGGEAKYGIVCTANESITSNSVSFANINVQGGNTYTIKVGDTSGNNTLGQRKYEYSTDGGKNWVTAATNSNAEYKITIPTGISKIILKITTV